MATQSFRITTWNVNGVRNPFGYQPWRENRTFDAMFDILEADVVIMQELKIQRKDLRDDMVLVPGWDCYFSLPQHKKGYSGVAIYTRQSRCTPIRAEEGLTGVLKPPQSSLCYREMPSNIGGYPTASQMDKWGVDFASLDSEGRCVVVEFPAFVLLGIYNPANSNGLRDDYRAAFLEALDWRVRNLHAIGKRVVVAGDLNISCYELDSADADENIKSMGWTHEDYISGPRRRVFHQLLLEGDVVPPRDEGREQPLLSDIVRAHHPGREGMYTHWEQKINARPGNYGSRIDYVLCSIEMKEWVTSANIQEGLMGSDHCPVFATFADVVKINDEDVYLVDIMNPPDMFKSGVSQRSARNDDLCALSGRLMPEFDKRRNIKDMFKQAGKPKPIVPTVPVEAAPPFKRKVIESPSPQSTKKSKLARSTSGAGQQTLGSFFQSRHQSPMKAIKDAQIEKKDEPKEAGAEEAKPRISPPPSSVSTTLPSQDNDDSFDFGASIEASIKSRSQWSQLFKPRTIPVCEGHHEPCRKYDTKKKGFNCGRSFWSCARPVGPDGKAVKGNQWRCKTFIWDSDVVGTNGSGGGVNNNKNNGNAAL